MVDIASIPNTSVDRDVVYYHVVIKLPLRATTVLKRYSDFLILIQKLSKDLGINIKDFPYQIPGKSLKWFTSKDVIIQERKEGFIKFLNEIIQDKDLQNHPLIHSFLELPVNFEFTASVFNNPQNGTTSKNIHDLQISDVRQLDTIKWLELSRKFKFHIQDLIESYESKGASILLKVSTREKINKIVRPNLLKLEEALNYNIQRKQIDQLERNKRQSIMKEIHFELTRLTQMLESSSTSKRDDLFNNNNNSTRRIFGGNNLQNNDTAQETNDTLPLNNTELLQQQVQVHKLQDQELEQLRKIIQRQKQIGEVINIEVEEQNELLDQFNEDVEKSADKLRNARGRARKIG